MYMLFHLFGVLLAGVVDRSCAYVPTVEDKENFQNAVIDINADIDAVHFLDLFTDDVLYCRQSHCIEGINSLTQYVADMDSHFEKIEGIVSGWDAGEGYIYIRSLHGRFRAKVPSDTTIRRCKKRFDNIELSAFLYYNDDDDNHLIKEAHIVSSTLNQFQKCIGFDVPTGHIPDESDLYNFGELTQLSVNGNRKGVLDLFSSDRDSLRFCSYGYAPGGVVCYDGSPAGLNKVFALLFSVFKRLSGGKSEVSMLQWYADSGFLFIQKLVTAMESTNGECKHNNVRSSLVYYDSEGLITQVHSIYTSDMHDYVQCLHNIPDPTL